MRPFRFCPSCGASIGELDETGGSRCPSCGRSWYRNPAPTVAAALVNEDRALVVVRAVEPEKGRYDMPGGFLKPGEDPLEGVKREVKEELGVEIEVSERDFLGAAAHQYGDEGDWLLSLGFKGRIKSGRPEPADDVAELRWVTLEELDGLDFAWEHNRDQTRRALQDG